jgi:uncharacterized protein with FMN-binding domain
MPRGLVALSSSAVAAIYFAGYLATQGADARLAEVEAAPVTAIVAPATGTPSSTPTPLAIQRQPATVPTSPPTVAATSPPAASTAYRDGTYRGSGTSRRGGVAVAVTVQGGRIINVAFTQVTTQYPVSRIAALPAEVVARQSAQVDRVSGATFSVQAFQQAVQQALAQAQPAGSSAAGPAA